MSENPELEVDEEQVDLDPDPAPEDGLGEDDFAEFDHTDSYQDVDPNYVPIVDPGGEPDDGDEDLTDEEIEPPDEDDELAPFWASYELQGRNLDEGTAWQSLATEPYTGQVDVEVEGLTAGARWEFRVRLIDQAGRRSKWSDHMVISLPTDFTPPPAPTAPAVDENNGYISSWWDGELTGEKPKDFSHIVKYLQQMHPEDDPEGEPGDPYRFSTLGDAGVFSVGFLLSGVLYRTWYTAVDTSGNESPWSDIVEFTPSSAFNTDELRADLEHLNTERLPALEQSLTEEVGKATQAVADFRTEWDESGWDPEAMADLEARQGTLESDLSTGLSEAHQAISSFRTEWDESGWDPEAISSLEARQGTLESDLATGLSNADTRIDSLAVGDLFVDNAFKARHVDMEDFTADAGFIDNAFVNLIQGKMANFDQALIGGNLLKDRSIATRHLTVTDTTDFAPDPIDYAAAWDFVRARVTANTSSFEGAAIALDNTATSDSQARGPILPVHPGDTIYVGAHVGWQGSAPRAGTVYLRMEWFEDATSSRETYTSVVSTTSAGLWLEGTTTVPDYATHARFYIYATSNSDNPGTIRIRSSKVRVQTGGELIVDGSIKARHGDFADITASDAFLDNAMVNLIQGRMANFDEALIGGTLLKNNSVATKHLTVTNTEDLWADEWLEDLLDNTYIFAPGGIPSSSAGSSRFHAENPSDMSSMSIQWTTLDGDRGWQVRPSWVSGSLNQRMAFRLGPGKGIPVRPGEKYTFRCRVRDFADTGNIWLYMAYYDRDSGDYVDRNSINVSGRVDGADEGLVWTFTVPDGAPRMHMVPSINFLGMGGDEDQGRSILRPQLFRAMDGKLIVDGLLQATTGELQELFFDEAVGNAISVGIANALVINADQITSNSWNGQVLTGPVMQSHTASNTGWKIEPGNGLQMWDDSGVETVRFDGSINRVLGSFETGNPDPGGSRIRFEPEGSQRGQIPAIFFVGPTSPDIPPQIAGGDWGYGDPSQLFMHSGEDGQSYGASQLTLGIETGIHLTRSGGSYHGVGFRSGERAQSRQAWVSGQLPSTGSSIRQEAYGMTSSLLTVPASQRMYQNWSVTPPMTGVRRVFSAGARLSNSSTDNSRALAVSYGHENASGFVLVANNTHTNGAGVSFRFTWKTTWIA